MSDSKLMKVIQLIAPNELKTNELSIPIPRKGHVLVKMLYAPINPSDLAFLTGGYGIKKPYPVVPGIEGCGIVVSSGEGLYGKLLINKRVACVASNGDGTWAEYMVTEAVKCIPIKEKVSSDQGSMLFVNPLTALAFVEMANKERFYAIVMSAAGSALSKMVLHLAHLQNIPFIGLVRRNEQIEPLIQKGASAALNVAEHDFELKLRNQVSSYKKVLYLDAVSGGKTPYKILNCLPDESKMLIYGRLEQQSPVFNPQDLLFHHYSISGFWLNKVAASKGFLQSFFDTRAVQKMLSDGFETTIQQTFALSDFAAAIDCYVKNMSAGKVLFKME